MHVSARIKENIDSFDTRTLIVSNTAAIAVVYLTATVDGLTVDGPIVKNELRLW